MRHGRDLCLGSSRPQWRMFVTIPRFTFTVVDEFRRLLRQFLINFHEILHTLFSIHVVTTLKISRSFDKYFKS